MGALKSNIFKNKNFVVNQLDNTTAEILFYGLIDGIQINAADFVKQIQGLDKQYSIINIRINSGGGNVFDGIAIFNAIKNCKALTKGYIDGIAASMGGVVAISCKKLYMSNNAMFMTHRAMGEISGTADELNNTADLLEQIDDMLAQEYANKTGLTKEEAKQRYLGNEDKWLTATEALNEKIIDGIYDAPKIANRNQFNAMYRFQSIKNELGDDVPDESLNVEEILQEAVSNNDITPEQSSFLKKQFQNDPKELIDLLKDFAKNRINYLMSLSWDELDKSELGKELHDKYYQGWAQKFFIEFGKMPANEEQQKTDEINEDELDNLIRFAIDNNDISPEVAWQMKENFKNDLDRVKKRIEEIVQERVNYLMELDWDTLDKQGFLPELKRKYKQGFLQKFKDKFGVDYKGDD